MQGFDARINTKKKNKPAFVSGLTYQPHNKLKVIEVRNLTDSAYVLRLERKNIRFTAGQHISLGIEEDGTTREYSIYSGENDPYLEVLIKEVKEGLVSKQLKKLKAGERVKFDGPVGYFLLDEERRLTSKLLFIASGTGIAPFRSFVRTYPELDYKLLHGVRNAEEAYERSFYDPDRHILCTTGDDKGDFSGRVTDYLKSETVHPDTLVYLCGNCNMIHDAYDILLEQGVPADHVHSEVYF
ncbi:MAG: hypothetical protein K9G67_03755 [Bacteroidales bacterium]|nr:hypothetical protein [Bacteroidales bacterium]MCF8349928.1 hypothetical protein [Bacteroidales bacterium]MCF8375445.1 hypothetical protein [Bacteroidales bacterium]MCF8401351.1 hypothetical protein [Bacteroidales bacterium]